MKYDVFISYSSHDQKVVEGLCAYLESQKIRCFVAYRDILPTDVWASVIVDALEQSRMMVVVFSPHFNLSRQVDREISLASEAMKPILTFRISDDAFKGVKKYYLENINWIDAFPDPEMAFGSVARHIVQLLNICPTENAEVQSPQVPSVVPPLVPQEPVSQPTPVVPPPIPPTPPTPPIPPTPPTPPVEPPQRETKVSRQSLVRWVVLAAVAIALIVGGVVVGRLMHSRPTAVPQAQVVEELKAEVVIVPDTSVINNIEAPDSLPVAAVDVAPVKVEEAAPQPSAKAAPAQNLNATPRPRRAASKVTIEPKSVVVPKDGPSVEDRVAKMVLEGKGRNGLYEVGYYFNRDGKEGIVFEVTQDGRHGKIISMQQMHVAWAQASAVDKPTNAVSRTRGDENAAMIERVGQWATLFPAYAWCRSLGADWYLPSIDELRLFTINDEVRYKVNATLGAKQCDAIINIGDHGFYWSSTEGARVQSNVWVVNMYDGKLRSANKVGSNYIRAVAQF